MNKTDDILDPLRLNYNGDFTTQVDNLMQHVRLTADEVRQLKVLFDDLEMSLQILAPGLQVIPFGSIVTGLGIKTSDVDCFIALPHEMYPNVNYVIYARDILRRNFRKFTKLFAITTAKVPIVKFLHIPTNCHCDVNFKTPAGVQNSQLISILLRMDNSNRPLKLAVLIKYWSNVHKITGTNLLASYSLTMMVIFYLQVINILPSVMDLQRHVPPYMVDNWNSAFNNNYGINIDNMDTTSLYDLLGGFFKCYANLNFAENVISPYLGCLVNKELFKNLEYVPPEFVLYKHNILTGICKPLKTDSFMCVQDPFEHDRNTCASVYPKLATRIKAHFEFAAKKFNELKPEEFLKAILTEDPNKPDIKVNKKSKKVFNNKVVKHKNRKRGLQNKHNILKCYAQIKGLKRYK